MRLQLADARCAHTLPLSTELQAFLHKVGWAALQPLSQQGDEEAAASVRALVSARRCGHMGCIELAGANDTALRLRRCTGCGVAKYCSERCQRADWRTHRRVCRQLAAAAAAAAQLPAAAHEQQEAAGEGA